MAEIAIELAAYEPVYDDMAGKFADHLLWIAQAMNRTGGRVACGMRKTASTRRSASSPTARRGRLKVRSMVGLLPICATTVIEPWQRERVRGALTILDRSHGTYA